MHGTCLDKKNNEFLPEIQINWASSSLSNTDNTIGSYFGEPYVSVITSAHRDVPVFEKRVSFFILHLDQECDLI